MTVIEHQIASNNVPHDHLQKHEIPSQASHITIKTVATGGRENHNYNAQARTDSPAAPPSFTCINRRGRSTSPVTSPRSTTFSLAPTKISPSVGIGTPARPGSTVKVAKWNVGHSPSRRTSSDLRTCQNALFPPLFESIFLHAVAFSEVNP